jgi:hypothetical protein
VRWIELDRVAYMTSPPDANAPGPFDVMVGFWNEGTIDNFVADCVR